MLLEHLICVPGERPRYGYPQWFRLVTGAVEVIGLPGWSPGSSWTTSRSPRGSGGVTMVVAMFTDIWYAPPTFVAPIVLLALNVAVVALRLAE